MQNRVGHGTPRETRGKNNASLFFSVDGLRANQGQVAPCRQTMGSSWQTDPAQTRRQSKTVRHAFIEKPWPAAGKM